MAYSRQLSDFERSMYKAVYDDVALSNGRIERRQAISSLIELGLDEETIEVRKKSWEQTRAPQRRRADAPACCCLEEVQ